MAYIYKITNPKNRVYIGSTKNISSRKRDYSNLRCKQQIKLYNSLKKYGWDSHIFEIIEEVKEGAMYVAERKWQEFYRAVEEGLNCLYVDTADKPRVYGADTRKRMSAVKKGLIKSSEWQERINLAKRGKPLSEEHKLKISMTKLGVRESEEVRLKKSKAHTGKKHSKETIEKIKAGQKNKRVFSKKVAQYTSEGIFLKEWLNCKEASESMQINTNYIRDAARGMYNHKAYGFIWKYV